MTRHWTVLHSAVFAGGILLVGMLAVWRASLSTPPGLPRLPDSASMVNGELAKTFETHYDAVFPARNLGVSLWAAIELALFNEGRPGVRIGTQGWLYTAEEFTVAADAPRQIALHLALIARVRDQLAQRGAGLLVAVVPAKTRVYPEHLGAHRPAALHAALHGEIHAGLKSAQVHSPDLLTALTVCKKYQPVFLRTDTHWTPEGARCAARAIAAAAHGAGLAAEHGAQYRTRSGAAQVHRGDLFKFLPLEPYFAVLLPAEDALVPQFTESLSGASLLDDQAAPRVALVGTSYSAEPRWNFTGALQQALGEDVVNVSAEGQGPFVPMLDYLRSEELRTAPPRLVIWEIPERYLPMSDPRMPFEQAPANRPFSQEVLS